jgi:nuclear RNA export factor
MRELRVTGWADTEAAKQQDGGVSAILGFLERRASIKAKKASNHRNAAPSISIKKHITNGPSLHIFVPVEQAQYFLNLNNFVFSERNLTIRDVTGNASSQSPTRKADNDHPDGTNAQQLLQNFLDRRYNLDTKILDLSALKQDQELRNAGLVDASSMNSKFFPALMAVADSVFKSAQQKKEAIQGVTIANNDFVNLRYITSLAGTFPNIKNLDLSNNKIESTHTFSFWKHRLRNLDYIIVSGNPLEQNEPDFVEKLKNMFPTLRIINGIQIRSDEDILREQTGSKRGKPVQPALFKDEAQIVETFIPDFIAGFDTNRPGLVAKYYDKQSTFSYSVNNHAPTSDITQQKPQPNEWSAYIKNSRNMKALGHLGPRMRRQFRGQDEIRGVFETLPATQHPNFTTDLQKWCIESQPQPGIPDPTGNFGSVNGFMISIHGEFTESDPEGRGQKQRSFDRIFILGPGVNNPVTVVSDMLTIRSYSGYDAFKPSDVLPPINPNEKPKTEAVAMQWAKEFSRITGMTVEFAKQCLVENDFDVDQAMAAFRTAQPNLPPNAFLQQPIQ